MILINARHTHQIAVHITEKGKTIKNETPLHKSSNIFQRMRLARVITTNALKPDSSCKTCRNLTGDILQIRHADTYFCQTQFLTVIIYLSTDTGSALSSILCPSPHNTKPFSTCDQHLFTILLYTFSLSF